MAAEFIVSNDSQISIKGDLVFDTVSILYSSIPRLFNNTMDYVVNLSEVEDCDSASLVLLLGILRFTDKVGITVRFTHLPKSLLTLIKLYNLKDIIHG